MSLEDDLRVALRERADAPPEPLPDLLAGVHDGVRRANRTPIPIGTTTESIRGSPATAPRKSAISSRWLMTLSARTSAPGTSFGANTSQHRR